MEGDVQHAQVPAQRVALQHLHGHQQRVLQQVVVHHAVAHDDAAVVGAGCKERVPGVEGHGTQGLLVVPQHFVGLGGKVQVEPHQLAVVAATDDVVPCRVHSHAGHPLAVGHQLLGELLPQQVVDADAALGGHQQEGPGGVEGHTLHLPVATAEWTLAAAPAQLVEQHLGVAWGGQHHSQVVPTCVPRHLCHGLVMADAQPQAPLALLLGDVQPAGRLHSRLLSRGEGTQQLVRAAHHQPISQQWVQQQHRVLRGCSHQADGGVGVPGDAPDHTAHRHGPHAAGSGHLPEPQRAVIRA